MTGFGLVFSIPNIYNFMQFQRNRELTVNISRSAGVKIVLQVQE